MMMPRTITITVVGLGRRGVVLLLYYYKENVNYDEE